MDSGTVQETVNLIEQQMNLLRSQVQEWKQLVRHERESLQALRKQHDQENTQLNSLEVNYFRKTTVLVRQGEELADLCQTNSIKRKLLKEQHKHEMALLFA